MSDEPNKSVEPTKKGFVTRVRTAPMLFWAILGCAVVITILSIIAVDWQVGLTIDVGNMAPGFFIAFFGKLLASMYPLMIILSVLGAFGTLYIKSVFNKIVFVAQIIDICVISIALIIMSNI